ncbi:hypothetical protein EW145_g1855 [Phellinidium pouzarii]|uniref:Protein kinase domain-containing protein n=1 Tax=Phellinidium pouzarii TaxID=167371 RepID=A0A4S4LDG1_9AGAM|nr:hypothetical protein EW145_g1855 [Phellinidium pouzarii]
MDNKPSLDDLFAVEIANTKSVSLLKTAIKAAMIQTFADIEAPRLHLWKVNIPTRDDAVFEEKLEAYMKNDHKILEYLRPAKLLYDIFPKQHDAHQLSIIIKEPSVYRKEEEEEEENEHYQMFRQIILTVQKKGEFSHSDEALNGIAMWTAELPAFVKVVEGNLNTKRDLPVRDKEALLREFDLSPNYDFGTSYKFTQRRGRERRREELLELTHFRFGSQSWLLSMLLKVKGEGNASYPYTPESDFSVWKGGYPILLCEIHSINSNDEARLHLQAAYCVRLANHQLQQEGKKKEAVIVVIYVSEDFKAHLRLFFEAEKGEVEDGPPRRVTRSSHAALALAPTFENGPPVPTIFYTEEVFQLDHTPDQADPETVGTDRLRGRGRGLEMSAFQADKYQLVDTNDPLLNERDDIYRVRQIGDESKTIYAAKRLHKDLKELKILQALETVERRCENINCLVDTIKSSVGKCIVLPKLKCVGNELSLGSDGGALRGHYIDLSRDLAREMTFLHDQNIAHLDVKPNNLVYTSEYHLQIIDFDLSVFVESEDEEMKGYIGSEGYMAPEIESWDGEVPYSPIKADRFSCGIVFKDFADVHDGDDEGLRLAKSRRTALHDNDNIIGIVRATAVRHNGRSQRLVAPNTKAQAALTRSVAHAGINQRSQRATLKPTIATHSRPVPHLFVVSAKAEKALLEYLRAYIIYCEHPNDKEKELDDMLYRMHWMQALPLPLCMYLYVL